MNDKLRIISGSPSDVEERVNKFLSNNITIKNISERVIYTNSGVCVTIFIYYDNPNNNPMDTAQPADKIKTTSILNVFVNENSL